MPDLRLQTTHERLEVYLDEGTTPVVVQNAPAAGRPFLHPVQAPSGIGSVTEDAPPHHPWQHGLYIGLNDVSGIGFWSEGLSPANLATDGGFRSRLTGKPAVSEGTAHWQVETDYLHPSGERMLRDVQSWSLEADDSGLVLRLRWVLTADQDLVFGRYDYGGLFLRMPYRTETGGTAIDSEGGHGPASRARWVAVRMPLPESGETATVAVLDHPGNLEHPVPWRIDNQLGVGPSPCLAGPWELAAGESQVFRYGVVVGGPLLTDQQIDARWDEFAEAGA